MKISYVFGYVLALFSGRALAVDPAVLVLNNTNHPPYSTAQGDGYVDRIAFEAFRRLGLQLKLVQMPAERGLLSADNGSIDGDLTRIAGLEAQYPHLQRVPEKLMDWEFAAFSKYPERKSSVDAVRARPVGLIKGWKIYEKMTAGSVSVTTADDADQLFRLLRMGRVDTALYERWLGRALITQAGDRNIYVNLPLLARREMFIYLNEKHAEMVPRLAVVLRELKNEGFYAHAFRAALGPYVETGTP